MAFAALEQSIEHVGTAIIGAAIEVHRQLGPGFLERIYQEALCLELHARGINFERERSVLVMYRGVGIPGQRIDLVVENCVIVELKAARGIDPSIEAKVISYLRSTGIRLGYILNFNATTMKAGVQRIVV